MTRAYFKSDFFALVVLGLFPLIAYVEPLLEHRLLGPGDGVALHLPMRTEAFAAYRDLSIPFLNTREFLGTPLLAAYRGGFRTFLFPAANTKDLTDIPADVRAHLDMVPVETMDDVFEAALSHVIVPQRIGSNFVIEVEEPGEEEETSGIQEVGRRRIIVGDEEDE